MPRQWSALKAIHFANKFSPSKSKISPINYYASLKFQTPKTVIIKKYQETNQYFMNKTNVSVELYPQ